MKTITEFRPLIYGDIFSRAEQRRLQRRHVVRWLKAVLPIAYFGAAVQIISDTGLAPWDLRFWLIFLPIFAIGERALWELSRGTQRRTA